MSLYSALAGRIRESLSEIRNVVKRIDDYIRKAQTIDDQAYWDATALNLHGFYSGIEHIFEDIARTVDASVPLGPEWHVDLLIQMGSDMKDIRPPVVSRETRLCLDEYRGFRHVVRNVYTFNLRPSRIKDLATDLPECYSSVMQELMAFASFLDSLE
ncbi:MAG: hypothetical protein U9R58_14075 [Chloroflexota bacterium]|nr:hypothetical protein [Chloroflexota bacterium]